MMFQLKLTPLHINESACNWIPVIHYSVSNAPFSLFFPLFTLPFLFRYERLLELCRKCGVVTPEDPFLRYRGAARGRPDTPFVSPSSSEAYAKKDKQRDADDIPLYICPIFTLYDYSFRPNYVKREEYVAS